MRTASELAQLSTRWRYAALAVGLVTSLPMGAAAWLLPRVFFPAYLVAFLFWCSIASGCLAIEMLQHLTGGGWGLAIRRTLEAGHSTFPLLVLAGLPILLGLPHLYPWAQPATVSLDPVLQFKSVYLNPNFYQLRAALYFAIWIFCSWFLNRRTGAKSTTDLSASERLAGFSGLGIILWGLTVTFAAIDWSMSLEPHFASSIYGVIFMAGHVLSAMSFVILMIVLLRGYSPVARVLTKSRLQDLGNLLLAFMLFWTYVSFTQYLVIWSGNLPEEASWYFHRGHDGWQYVTLLLIGFNFAIPFALLLNRPLKRRPWTLAIVASLLLAIRFIDLAWQTLPAVRPADFHWIWLCPLSVISVGSFWLTAFLWKLPARAAYVSNDVQRKREAHHE